MRVLTSSMVSGFLVIGLAIGYGTAQSNSAQLNFKRSTPNAEHITVSNSRSRDSSYRGSGRRVILALPIPIYGHQGSNQATV